MGGRGWQPVVGGCALTPGNASRICSGFTLSVSAVVNEVCWNVVMHFQQQKLVQTVFCIGENLNRLFSAGISREQCEIRLRVKEKSV